MRPQFKFGKQRKVMCLKWLINYGHIDIHMSMYVCQFRVASFYEDPSMDQENVAMSSGGHLVVIHAVDLSSPLTVLPLYEYKCSMYDSICKTHVYIRMYHHLSIQYILIPTIPAPSHLSGNCPLHQCHSMTPAEAPSKVGILKPCSRALETRVEDQHLQGLLPMFICLYAHRYDN